MKIGIMMAGLMLAAVVVIGCKKEASTPAAATESLPADLFTATPPPGAIDVIAARQTAQDGQPIVIKGRIAGSKEPLADNRAIMTIADLSLPTCDTIPGDTCPTPWDICCEPTSEIAAKLVSVQVVSADGRPVKASLRGAGGIAPMKQVVIAGTVKLLPGSDVPVLEAKEIYVTP
ncbi:hypothetical protein BH09PLA1_BH09PLA1_08820 [soil metagenome]